MKRSQGQKIIDYLATGRGLTPLVALQRFSCFRLGARILELKRQGHPITSRLVKRGETYVALYRLERTQ